MNKQQLTEALVEWDEKADWSAATWPLTIPATVLIAAAARLVERLLPGECENCGGTGIAGVHRHIKPSTGEHLGDQDVPCGFCFDGQVWDEGIVEAVREAILNRPPSYFQDGTYVKWATEEARAALSALVELLTEKSDEAGSQ